VGFLIEQSQPKRTIVFKKYPTLQKKENTRQTRTPAYNSTYPKVAVHWLIEHLCFVSSSFVADSLVLRNRQLLVAANRYVRLSTPQNI
jgi:hypothetical protein